MYCTYFLGSLDLRLKCKIDSVFVPDSRDEAFFVATFDNISPQNTVHMHGASFLFGDMRMCVVVLLKEELIELKIIHIMTLHPNFFQEPTFS